jgi:hypothetical protein
LAPNTFASSLFVWPEQYQNWNVIYLWCQDLGLLNVIRRKGFEAIL